MTAGIGRFDRRTKIRSAAGLGQRLAGVEQARSDDRACLQEMGDGVVGAARLPDRGEPSHQAVAQIGGRGESDIRGG